MRIRDLAQAWVSYGYGRLHVLLQREGWGVNHKRVYRLYSQEGLMLRTKKPKGHVSCQRLEERPVAAGMDESWSMDFMSDELFDGRRIRLLTIVDNFTRESVGIPTLTCQWRPASGDRTWWRSCSVSRSSIGCPGPFGWTMGPSSPPSAWNSGPALMGWSWISAVLASPRTTLSSNHSTDGSGRNA